jgi:hypothetical protein
MGRQEICRVPMKEASLLSQSFTEQNYTHRIWSIEKA